MKVIDLLNKIANGEKVPERIKFDGYVFEKNLETDYTCFVTNGVFKYLLNEVFLSQLNDEIEIIEETKKIEKLECSVNAWFTPTQADLEIIKTLNKIIDYINGGNNEIS